jgi:prepilin-type N-terminal cleavage/methylation domain-containing protein/prepilin-type processing-associated H-X9-DG protein
MGILRVSLFRGVGEVAKPGFTLIELLVVTTIIAVLAGLVAPTLGRAKARARSIVCVNNLRQIGLANWMYFTDEGKPVHYDTWPSLWMLSLQARYSVVDKVRICPMAPERSGAQMEKHSPALGSVTRAWLVKGKTANYQGSYALNGYFYSDSPYGASNDFFQSESDIADTTNTPFFVDALWVDAWPLATDRPASDLIEGDRPLRGGLQRIAIPRHGSPPSAALKNFDLRITLPGAVNVSFADNHVETVRLEKLWGLYWHKNWVPPAQRPGLP